MVVLLRRVRVEQRAGQIARGPLVVHRPVLAQAETQRHDVAEVVIDVDARVEVVVVEVRDELGALVLVALEHEVESPRDASQRVREMALHSRGLVREPVADVLGDDLAVDVDLDVARQAVVGIEIRLAMGADEERRVDGAPAAVALAEHDVGAHRQALVDFRRVRELGVVERAVHVVAEQELGIAGLVARARRPHAAPPA